MPSPHTRQLPPLAVLFWVVILDYLAQLPYYLVNYYLPHQLAPTLSAVVLLGATLAWFLIGYVSMRRGRAFGFWVLLSFLVVEGLFYLHTLLFGAAVLQMTNPNPVVRAVFVIGYVTGIVSLIYAGLLIAFRSRYQQGASLR
jgi:hypothetical protein